MKPFRLRPWLLFLLPVAAAAHSLPLVEDLEPPPLTAHVRDIVQAMAARGAPVPAGELKALELAFDRADPAAIQAAIDHLCLAIVTIDGPAQVRIAPGLIRAELIEQGWRPFLVKVVNETGRAVAPLRFESPQAKRLAGSPAVELADRWLDAWLHRGLGQPGQRLEYRILELYSRDAGKRAARIGFVLGEEEAAQPAPGTEPPVILFDCRPSQPVTLRVKDHDGQPTTGAFLIRDAQDRIYPSIGKRLAPDHVFQQQVYRTDGDILRLPAGEYAFEFSRGPESRPEVRKVIVNAQTTELTFQARRWIDPSRRGWWSGDYHLHASGCGHYSEPTAGVHPDDMIKHVIGEDLKVAAVLTWANAFAYQSRFFLGAVDPASPLSHLLRYDVEVSGFGSHRSGHLCLLRLREQHYPGGAGVEHWPTLGLNTLRWAKRQGAVAGAAHAALGMQVPTGELPNFLPPPYSAGGANEYIVNVTHEVADQHGGPMPAVDFVSAMSGPPPWELNVWYHTLNAGFRPRLGGETDWPCLYGKRVGHGRTYVKLAGALDYDAWCEGLRLGASYVSDGYSHLMDFAANDVAAGTHDSEVRLAAPGKVRLSADVAALLAESPVAMPEVDYKAARTRLGYLEALRQKPHWHVERARIGGTREVPVEVVVNGRPVARRRVVADGRIQPVTFEVDIDRSSWIALRIYPSSHTNPIFVIVDGRPIRASRRSIAWCLEGVDLCWGQKQVFISRQENAEAEAAYEHARQTYRRRLAECDIE